MREASPDTPRQADPDPQRIHERFFSQVADSAQGIADLSHANAALFSVARNVLTPEDT